MARLRRQSKKEKRNKRNIILGAAALGVGVGGIALASGGGRGGNPGGGSSVSKSSTPVTSLWGRRKKNRQKLEARKDAYMKNAFRYPENQKGRLARKGSLMAGGINHTIHDGVEKISSGKKLTKAQTAKTNKTIRRINALRANLVAKTAGGRRNAPGVGERIHQKNVLPLFKDLKGRDVKSRIGRGLGRLSKQDQNALKKLGLRSQGGFKPGTSKKAKQDAARIMRSVGMFSRMRRLSYL